MDVQGVFIKLMVGIIPVLSVIYVVIGIRFFKSREGAGFNYFSMLMFACATYSFGYFLELNCISLRVFSMVRNYEFLGSVFIPSYGILFIAGLTDYKFHKKLKVVLYTASISIWMLLVTNPIHNLIYKSVDIKIVRGFAIAVTEKGQAFFSLMAYYAVFLIFSIIVLLKAYKTSDNKSDKNNFRFLLIIFQIPWIPMLIIIFRFDKYFDPTPATIMLICGLIMINEFRNDMLKLLIVKWKNNYSNIDDLALLVNREGNLICSNISAKSLLENSGNHIDNIITDLDNSILNNTHFSLNINNEPRWFTVHKNNYDTRKQYTSYILNDITEIMNIQKQIEYLSYHDQTTGLYNRRYYDMEIQRLCDEKYCPLTLVMADVNGLKLINDAFGHKAGDMVLQRISDILKKECRENDVVARIGGDEFVILLPETDSKNAEMLIERVNSAVNKEVIENIILSISIGYAVKKDSSDSIDETFMKAEDYMYSRKISESTSMRSRTVDLIMNSLYEKNEREQLHSQRVSKFCVAIAKAMNFSNIEIDQMKIAGLMHDIGKIGVSEETLNNTEQLNDDEWIEIRRHSEIGYRILDSVNEFSQIAQYILAHHERWDGKGYPKKIKGEELPLQSRIIAVADAYDAMTTERTYKQTKSMNEAIKEMIIASGTQFDPEIVKVFIEKVLAKDRKKPTDIENQR